MFFHKRDTSLSQKASQYAFFSKGTIFRSLFVLIAVLGLIWTTWRFLPQGEHQVQVHASGTNPIKHIVFIIKENHSFDNYFGRFPGAHGATTGLAKVNGVQKTITLAPIVDQPDDYCHVRLCYTKDYDNGAMDGFNLSQPCNTPPYGCYTAATQDQIPSYWAYATKYVLSDETYAPMGGPTYPNRLFSIAASSGNTIDTSAISLPTNPTGHTSGWGCDSAPGTTVTLYNGSKVFPCADMPTLGDRMDAAGLSWKYYGPVKGQGGYIWTAYDAINHIRNGPDWNTHVVSWQNFATDAQNGNLPAFSWVVPTEQYSEHPQNSTCGGENWTVQQINAVMQGPDWSSTAIFVSYDEWGGFYDHKAPPSVDALGYGFRVPMIIISPYAHVKSNRAYHNITHTVYELSSVLRFAEETFNLPNLGKRDATTNDMMDAFDFSQVWHAKNIRSLRNCGSLKPATMTDDE